MDTRISKRYALALFLLARERKLVEEIEKDLAFVNRIFEVHPLLRNILLHPGIEKDKKQRILTEVFCSISKESINFLKRLVEKNRMENLGEIFERYKFLRREFYNTVEIVVSSAFPLSPSESETLVKVMEGITNKKIEIKEKLDDELIGGIRIEYLGRVYDWTVKSRLERIGLRLADA